MPEASRSVAGLYIDPADDPLRLGPGKIDRKKAVLKLGARHFHAIGQQKHPLELARGDATMEILPALVVELPPANDQLVFLQRDIQLVPREARDGERNAVALGTIVVALDAFDVIGRIAIGRRLGEAIHRPLDFIEAEQEGRGKIKNAGHARRALQMKRPVVKVTRYGVTALNMGAVFRPCKRMPE
jgi:hypothetical protein